MTEVNCPYCGKTHSVIKNRDVYIIKCDLMDIDKTPAIADKWKTLKERRI